MKFKKARGLIEEFKAFIMRGNVLDMAVGVIVATAFGKITTSLVNDVFMPFVGWIIGDFDLSKINITLAPAVIDESEKIVKEAVVLGIGTFLVTVIDFLIISAIVFIIIKAFAKAKEISEKTRAKEIEEIPEEKKPTTEELLAEILETIKKEK